ncbi:MAG: hypothetical protein HY209_01700 [Candidatus Omnitrophica bacterium]|nr:hypothetical protein [Candidatus Omnitrophota bacterium]
MEQVLIKDENLEGHYVAVKGFNDPSPIADGKDPQEVHALAIRKGFKNPLIIYVPLHGMIQIY